MFQMTTSQIDKLGKRLTKEPISDVDLNLLDQYRLSFSEAYEYVVSKLHDAKFNVIGRQIKSTQSIISKLHRERTRLSTMQDIAGCRLIVPNLLNQNDVHSELLEIFDASVVKVIDRRIQTSHGYRAIHLIILMDGRVVELQLRTSLQDYWANFCEEFSDYYGYEHKYGGGNPRIQFFLDRLSKFIVSFENNKEFDVLSAEAYFNKFEEALFEEAPNFGGGIDVISY